MTSRTSFYGLLFLGVFGYTVFVLATDGYMAILQGGLASFGALQITVDLIAALLLVMMWIYHDARSRGKSPWPWILATCAIGTSAPLLYLFFRERERARTYL